jgi:beta-hydroxylase
MFVSPVRGWEERRAPPKATHIGHGNAAATPAQSGAASRCRPVGASGVDDDHRPKMPTDSLCQNVSANRCPGAFNVLSWKGVRKTVKRVVPLTLAAVFLPKTLIFYAVCGLLDVLRNGKPKLATFERYFFGNGVLTWILSPFNLLMDVLTLPYWNRGVYELSDLPPAYREEIKGLLETARDSDLVERLAEKVGDQARAMVFFKWYGKNLETSVEVPRFHRSYRYVRTIGVSVFNKRQETSEHFGPLRVTLRLLYNINDIEEEGRVHRWRDEKLFIFDDTLLHKSVNATDAVRYCLFVDLLRPSLLPPLIDAILWGVRIVSIRVNYLFYKNWRFIR